MTLLRLPVGYVTETLIGLVSRHLGVVFTMITAVILSLYRALELVFGAFPPWLLIGLVTGVAWWLLRTPQAAWIFGGLLLVWNLGLWETSVQTMALVTTAATFSIALGIPIGVLAAESRLASPLVTPILDAMQTTPSFVYLIPAVIFFGVGVVPGVVATMIFALPPAAKLTALGLRQVDPEVLEAGEAFGCTRWQILLKIKMPLALPSVLVGIHQCIMMSLAMVVVASMIGAPGLGQLILRSLQRMEFGLGAEAGIGIAIVAAILDKFRGGLGGRAAGVDVVG